MAHTRENESVLAHREGKAGSEAWKDAPSRETTHDDPQGDNTSVEALRKREENAPGDHMHVRSNEFRDDGRIPTQLTLDGANQPPVLTFENVPAGVGSLALLVEDPDAPDPRLPSRHLFTHLVLYDIPPTTQVLNLARGLPAGAKTGRNDFGHARYDGPKPPSGEHRYIFRLLALDRMLGDLREPDRAAFLAASDGHVLAEARLVGRYQRAA